LIVDNYRRRVPNVGIIGENLPQDELKKEFLLQSTIFGTFGKTTEKVR
jgi:hypothetical protein